MIKTRLQAFLVIGSIIALTLLTTIYREELADISSLGYFGVFFGCLVANSTLFLPAPSSTIVFTAGAIYNPFLVAILGSFGATLGEVIGYLAGLTGRSSFDTNNTKSVQIKSYLDKYGMGAVFFFAFLPLPLFDLVGVVAGGSQMKFIDFIVACTTGKLFKMLIYAYAGAGLLPIIFPFLDQILKINN